MNDKRYRFFAWLDRKTNFTLGAITDIFTVRHEPKDQYSFADQVGLVFWGVLWVISKPLSVIYKYSKRITLSVKKPNPTETKEQK